MRPFTYLTPTTAEQAVALLAAHGDGACVIAGGQSLLLAMKERAVRPRVLVSLGGVGELSGVRTGADGELVVGATTTYATLSRTEFPGWHRVIAEMAGDLADRPVRTMGTLGGALCSADPRYDMLALTVGTGAEVEVLSTSGSRSVPAEQFLAADTRPVLASDEIVTAVHFPSVDTYRTVVFEKFRQRTFDAAVASVLLAVGSASDGTAATRVTVGACVPRPVVAHRSAEGITRGELDPVAAGESVAAEVLGSGPGAAVVQYHRELVKALTRQTLSAAVTTVGS